MKKKAIFACGLLFMMLFVWSCGKGSDNAGTDAAKSSEDAVEDAVSQDADDESGEGGESGQSGEAGEGGESDEGDEAELSGDDILENTARAAEDMLSEDGGAYAVDISAGNNLGTVPVVAGSAVVLLDGEAYSIYQGEYVDESISAELQQKLSVENEKAAAEGKIGDWAFYRESALRNYAWQGEIQSIGKFAFSRSGLTSIHIPEGVTSIGYAAFYHCDSLTEVVIPESVTTIEENAFARTPWLENWMTDEDRQPEEDDFLVVGDGILIAYRGSEENPDIPERVKTVVSGVIK